MCPKKCSKFKGRDSIRPLPLLLLVNTVLHVLYSSIQFGDEVYNLSDLLNLIIVIVFSTSLISDEYLL